MKTFFVSSTFKDMNYERDAIKEITLPKLNAIAKKYGQCVSFCDLRWGIDTREMSEEEGSQKVLKVCLDEIDRCQPPLVIILGERYGWIPPSELVRGAADYKSLVIDDYEKSVTALEIEYGALCEERKREHTLVYMRQMENAPDDYLAEDDEHSRRLDALKARLKELTNGKIRTYNTRFNGESVEGVDDFASMLATDLAEIMVPQWESEAALSPFELDRKIQWDYIEEKAKSFKGRSELLEEICSNIENGKKFTFIKGETGSGKSTLFSAAAARLREAGWDVLPFIGGYTLESNDALDIINNTIYYLEEALGKEHRTEKPSFSEGTKNTDEAQKRLAELCYEYARQGKRLMIMLDSVERLYPDEARDKLRFIPENLSENIRFFLTANQSFSTVGVEYFTLSSLSVDEIEGVVDGIIKRTGRELDKQVVESIKNMPSSKNPLYLSLLIQRLLMMNKDDFLKIRKSGDGMDAISQRQREIIASCPADTDSLCAALIFEAGKRINQTLIQKITRYIAFSRFGLREADLERLIGKEWRSVDFAHFLSYMGESFIMRDDGRFDFFHQSIREGIIKNCESAEAIYNELFEHFYRLDEDDGVRQTEFLYHAIKADKSEVVTDYVIRTVNKNDKQSTEEKNCDIKTVYDVTRSDGVQWIVSLINRTKDPERAIKLSYFVSEAVINKFLLRQEDIALGVAILKESQMMTRALIQENGAEAERAYLQADLYLSLCLLLNDAKNNKDTIEASVSNGLKRCRQMYEQSQDEKNGELLSLFLYVASFYYGHSDVREKTVMALSLFEELLELTDKRKLTNPLIPEDMASKYSSLALLYSRLNDRDSLNTALEYALKAQQAARAQGKSGASMISVNALLGNIYLSLGGIENIEKALCAYENIYKEMKIAYARSGEVSDMEALLTARNNYVKALLDSGKEGAVEMALPEALENIKAGERIAAELDTVSAIRPLVLFYMNAAGIYNALGGSMNMAFAIEMYKKAEEVAEIIAKRIALNGATLELVNQKVMIARAYSTANVSDNGENLVRLVKEAIEVLEAVKADTPDVQSLDMAEWEIYNMATLPYINRAILTGACDSLDEAIAAAKTAVMCAKRLKEADVNDWDFALANSLNNAGFAYRSIYLVNKQIAENFTLNIGSEENMAGMWIKAAQNRPREEIWLYSLTNEDFNEVEENSFFNLMTAILFDEDLSEDEKTDKLNELSNELDKKAEEAEEIKDAARLRSLEYYLEAIEIMEERAARLKTADCYVQLSTMYQNVAEIYAYVETEENLHAALEYQKRAVSLFEDQHKRMGSEMSELHLIRAKISLIQIYFMLKDNKTAFELVYPVLKDCERLYASWPVQELKLCMDLLCNNFVTVCSDDSLAADPVEACRIFETYIERLKIDYEAQAELEKNQYATVLNYYSKFVFERGLKSLPEALSLAKEAYRILKQDSNPDTVSMTIAEQCLLNLKLIYQEMDMQESDEYFEVLKETVELCLAMSEYTSQNDITEQAGEKEAREQLLLMTIQEITFNPGITDEENIDMLTSGYYVAKAMRESEDEELVSCATEYIEFMEGALAIMPGGIDALNSIYSEDVEDYESEAEDDSENAENDSDTDTGLDENDLAALLSGIDPTALEGMQELAALLDPETLAQLLGGNIPLPDDDDEDDDEDK